MKEEHSASNSIYLKEQIPKALSGERLDRALALLADISRSTVTKLINSRDVIVDGAPVANGALRVRQGSVIEVSIPPKSEPRPEPNGAVVLNLVYVDDQVIVVDKPSDLVVHPGSGNQDDTLVNGLLAKFPEISAVGETHRPGIVHRLDRMTSGLLVVARTKEAYHNLVKQLAAHEPQRTYTALVWGHLQHEQGSIDAPIGRCLKNPTKMTVTEQGKHALTHYQVLQHLSKPSNATLLACRLSTGRTHQIRVHLQSIGHPIVGDRSYDGGRPQIELARPFLHACKLQFKHPTNKKQLAFESPLPAELERVLDLCGT